MARRQGFKDVMTGNRWFGLGLIVLAAIIWGFRPLQDCAWWNILCEGGSILITPIFVVISVTVLIFGVYKLLKG